MRERVLATRFHKLVDKESGEALRRDERPAERPAERRREGREGRAERRRGRREGRRRVRRARFRVGGVRVARDASRLR